MITRYKELSERLQCGWNISKSRSKQRGQTMVEFALILPTFLLLTVGLIYGGMMFRDYLSADRAAGDCATACGLYGDQIDESNLTRMKSTDFMIYSVVDNETTITRSNDENGNPEKVTAKLVLERKAVPTLVKFFISEEIVFEKNAPIINGSGS